MAVSVAAAAAAAACSHGEAANGAAYPANVGACERVSAGNGLSALCRGLLEATDLNLRLQRLRVLLGSCVVAGLLGSCSFLCLEASYSSGSGDEICPSFARRSSNRIIQTNKAFPGVTTVTKFGASTPRRCTETFQGLCRLC